MESLVFRALNEFDILCDPLNNGIASKKALYEMTKRWLESKESTFMSGLNDKEKDEYIKVNIIKYIKTHQGKLRRRFSNSNRDVRDVINSFVVNKDKESYYLLLQFLSTLNNHLVNGSKVQTEWISTTSSFDSVFKYYDQQKEHKVAVCLALSNGVFNDSTFVVDVSDKERISELKCLGKKMDLESIKSFIDLINADPWFYERANNLFHEYYLHRTDSRFMGYNFAAASHEVCFYNYIDPICICALLEQLQIDLIRAEIFNSESISLSKEEQKKALIDLKARLKQVVLESKSSYIMYVFEQLYLKNKNIDLITDSEQERNRMINVRNQIISRTVDLPSVLIKK